MAKDAYFFSHDANARNDPKILAMRSVYGSAGYGYYFMLLEIFREQENYKLPITKYTYDTLAMQLHCERITIETFINDCTKEFCDDNGKLLEKDDKFIWSNSFLRRMQSVDEKREQARQSALIRWGKPKNQTVKYANALPTQSEGNAIKGEYNKGEYIYNKENNIKENNKDNGHKKDVYGEFNNILLTIEEFTKLTTKFGQEETYKKISALSEAIASRGYKYKSHYATILNWARRDDKISPKEPVRRLPYVN